MRIYSDVSAYLTHVSAFGKKSTKCFLELVNIGVKPSCKRLQWSTPLTTAHALVNDHNARRYHAGSSIFFVIEAGKFLHEAGKRGIIFIEVRNKNKHPYLESF